MMDDSAIPEKKSVLSGWEFHPEMIKGYVSMSPLFTDNPHTGSG